MNSTRPIRCIGVQLPFILQIYDQVRLVCSPLTGVCSPLTDACSPADRCGHTQEVNNKYIRPHHCWSSVWEVRRQHVMVPYLIVMRDTWYSDTVIRDTWYGDTSVIRDTWYVIHVSCILYPVSCILYPVSCILRPPLLVEQLGSE